MTTLVCVSSWCGYFFAILIPPLYTILPLFPSLTPPHSPLLSPHLPSSLLSSHSPLLSSLSSSPITPQAHTTHSHQTQHALYRYSLTLEQKKIARLKRLSLWVTSCTRCSCVRLDDWKKTTEITSERKGNYNDNISLYNQSSVMFKAYICIYIYIRTYNDVFIYICV